MQTRHGAGGAGGLEGGGRIRKERELTWKDKLNAASQEKRGGKDKKSKRQEESEPTAAASDPASASSSQQHRQQREADEAQAHEAGEAAAGSDEEAQEKKKQKTAELVDDADSETVPAAAVEAASELLRSPPAPPRDSFPPAAPEALPEVVELQPALSWISPLQKLYACLGPLDLAKQLVLPATLSDDEIPRSLHFRPAELARLIGIALMRRPKLDVTAFVSALQEYSRALDQNLISVYECYLFFNLASKTEVHGDSFTCTDDPEGRRLAFRIFEEAKKYPVRGKEFFAFVASNASEGRLKSVLSGLQALISDEVVPGAVEFGQLCVAVYSVDPSNVKHRLSLVDMLRFDSKTEREFLVPAMEMLNLLEAQSRSFLLRSILKPMLLSSKGPSRVLCPEVFRAMASRLESGPDKVKYVQHWERMCSAERELAREATVNSDVFSSACRGFFLAVKRCSNDDLKRAYINKVQNVFRSDFDVDNGFFKPTSLQLEEFLQLFVEIDAKIGGALAASDAQMWSKTRVVFDGVKNNLKFTFSTLYENSAIFPPEEFEALWSRVPEACQLVHRFTLRINESDGKPQISEAMFRHLESKEKGNIFNNLVTCAAGYIPDYLGGGNILQSQKEVQETLQIFKGLKAACFPLRPQVRKGWTTSLTGVAEQFSKGSAIPATKQGSKPPLQTKGSLTGSSLAPASAPHLVSPGPRRQREGTTSDDFFLSSSDGKLSTAIYKSVRMKPVDPKENEQVIPAFQIQRGLLYSDQPLGETTSYCCACHRKIAEGDAIMCERRGCPRAFHSWCIDDLNYRHCTSGPPHSAGQGVGEGKVPIFRNPRAVGISSDKPWHCWDCMGHPFKALYWKPPDVLKGFASKSPGSYDGPLCDSDVALDHIASVARLRPWFLKTVLSGVAVPSREDHQKLLPGLMALRYVEAGCVVATVFPPNLKQLDPPPSLLEFEDAKAKWVMFSEQIVRGRAMVSSTEFAPPCTVLINEELNFGELQPFVAFENPHAQKLLRGKDNKVPLIGADVSVLKDKSLRRDYNSRLADLLNVAPEEMFLHDAITPNCKMLVKTFGFERAEQVSVAGSRVTATIKPVFFTFGLIVTTHRVRINELLTMDKTEMWRAAGLSPPAARLLGLWSRTSQIYSQAKLQCLRPSEDRIKELKLIYQSSSHEEEADGIREPQIIFERPGQHSARSLAENYAKCISEQNAPGGRTIVPLCHYGSRTQQSVLNECGLTQAPFKIFSVGSTERSRLLKADAENPEGYLHSKRFGPWFG